MARSRVDVEFIEGGNISPAVVDRCPRKHIRVRGGDYDNDIVFHPLEQFECSRCHAPGIGIAGVRGNNRYNIAIDMLLFDTMKQI